MKPPLDTDISPATPATESPSHRSWWHIITLLLIVAALVTTLIVLPVKDWLIRALEWTEGLGIWGPVFVVAFYIVACVLFLPGSILTLGAGFLFKVVLGTITVSIGSTLGACAAFLVGRTVARKWIATKVALLVTRIARKTLKKAVPPRQLAPEGR